MKTWTRILKLTICLLFLVSLGGCWNSRELNQLGIILGIGLDKDKESEMVKLTAQVVNPGQIKSGESNSGSGRGKAFTNFETKGNTVFSAVRSATSLSSRKLYFPHNQVIILGHSLAEYDATRYLDFFIRDPETRLNVLVLVAENSASEVLDSESDLEKVPADEIAKTVEEEARSASQSMVVRLYDFKERLVTRTTAPIAPIVKVVDENGKKKAMISGTAVFKGGKLVGELDKSEGRGLLWVLGEVKSGIIEAKSPEGNMVSMETVHAKGEFSPEISNGKVKIIINISEEGNVGEQAGSEDLSKLPEVAFLEEQKEKVIRSEVTAAINKAKEMDADIFGFGESIHKKYPEKWASMEDRWDEIFPETEVEIHVEAKLRLMGRITVPAVQKEE